MKYRPEIDGLRALAVLPVVFFHAGLPGFSGGFVGVDIFFVISGFLITGIIREEIDKGRFSFANFYERRVRRLLPPLYFMMLLTIPFAWFWLHPNTLKDFAQSLIAVSLFSSNMFFALKGGYFEEAAELRPMLHTWSLAVEEQYYFIFPALFFLAWRKSARLSVVSLIILTLASFGIAQWQTAHQPSLAYFLLPSRIWELLIGAIGSLAATRLSLRPRNGLYSDILAGLGLVAIAVSVGLYDSKTPFPGVYALLPVIGSLLVLLFAKESTRVGRFLSFPFIVKIGLLSYSIYLWHQPLFAFYRIRTTDHLSVQAGLSLSAFSIVLGYLSWKFVETPFRSRSKMSLKKLFPIIGSAAAVVCAFGMLGHVLKGYIHRTPPAYLSPDYYSAAYSKFQTTGVDGQACASEAGSLCLVNNQKEATETLLLVGDSHSADFVDEYRKYLVSQNLKGYQMSVGGCAFLESQRAASLSCKQAFKKLKDFIATSDPRRIFIVGNYYEHTEQESAKARTRDVDDFTQFLTTLLDEPRDVFFFRPRPNLAFDNLQVAMANKLGKQGVLAVSEPSRRAWDEALARFPAKNLHVFEQGRAILKLGCGAEACFNGHTKGLEPIYRDSNHLTQFGAQEVFRSFVEFMENSPRIPFQAGTNN